MVADGYPKAFAAAMVCTGAALSIVIPPSIGLVIYGVIAEVSIGDLFIAAILPGAVMGALMLAALPFVSRQRALAKSSSLTELAPMPYGEFSFPKRIWLSFKDAVWGLMTPVVILGGIYTGIFTPTEAAIVAVVYALFVGFFVYRSLTIPTLFNALVDASASSAVVMLVVTFASLFGWVVTVDDVVGRYSEGLLALSSSEWMIMLVMAVILLIAGMFMDAVTIMFISLPIFLPVVRALEWDPIWFGVFLMINLAIGLFTPPVGINLFVAANVAKLSLERIAAAAVPFLATSIIGLAIIALWPELTTYLLIWMK